MIVTDLFDKHVATCASDAALEHWTPKGSRTFATKDVARQVSRVAAGLIALGLKPAERVLLIAENRPEWAILDYATLYAGGVLVPVYTSLTIPQLQYILDNSGASIVVASNQALLDKLLAAAKGAPGLRQVVCIEPEASGPGVISLETIAARGDELLGRSPVSWREKASLTRENDIATIIYTSGTTGPPKGVMLSHGNLTSNVKTLCEVLDFSASDTALSFLPLCHVTQRLADYCYFVQGVHIVYVGLEDLSASLTAVRPTTFPAVPRVYEKARDSILTKVSKRPPLARALFHWGVGVGREAGRCRIERREPDPWLKLRHAVADHLVLSRVREGLGGRLRYVLSGGAPLNPEVMQFFLAAGVPILEGYGLTETLVLTVNRLERFKPGSVGPPLPGVELKLDDDGELLARGAGICQGYFRDEERTRESFANGWFRTGDLARIDEEGHLKITGRKKELLVTSGGKKVSPALIEQTILSNNLVSQVALVGDGRKFVSALLVPDRGRLLARCEQQGGARRQDASYETLLERPEIRLIYEGIIDMANRDLARYEQIKKFVLLPSEFTVEGGELTPTMKIKRRVVEEKYRALIESLYADAREG